jgi:cytochrome c-type biogenesis protein CcmH
MTTKRTVLFGLFLALTILLGVAVWPGAVRAQGGDGAEPTPVRDVTADEVNAISHKLYCPVCENIPLDVCGTAACARWREQVRSLLEGGASEEDVINYFVEQFGERVVGTPKDPTLNFLSWAVPALAAVLGAGIVLAALIRWRRSNNRESGGAFDEEEVVHQDNDYRARLEHDLQERE